MTTFIDISRTLVSGTAVWPGDTQFELKEMMQRRQGDSVNLTTLILSAHTGTHVDAPHHYSDDNRGIDQMDLSLYWGSAQVVTVARQNGPLFPADFAACDLTLAPRILVRSIIGKPDQTVFPAEFIYPSPELADFMAARNIILFGSDAPSMDAQTDALLPGHKALLKNGIAILEWLDLSQTADGLYELAALPLKIAGGDGSPVRAVLRKQFE